MQDQGRSLASSERPFSLGNQGFAVQGRSLAFVDSQSKTGHKRKVKHRELLSLTSKDPSFWRFACWRITPAAHICQPRSGQVLPKGVDLTGVSHDGGVPLVWCWPALTDATCMACPYEPVPRFLRGEGFRGGYTQNPALCPFVGNTPPP
jgi:hypothetical protein